VDKRVTVGVVKKPLCRAIDVFWDANRAFTGNLARSVLERFPHDGFLNTLTVPYAQSPLVMVVPYYLT